MNDECWKIKDGRWISNKKMIKSKWWIIKDKKWMIMNKN